MPSKNSIGKAKIIIDIATTIVYNYRYDNYTRTI